jgi:hypothetical protein
MNNFSPLPASASDPRLSRPEATAPNLVNPLLQARQHKLRRIVAWVVGGATLLMCVGLVRAAIRSHSEATPDVPAAPAVPAATPAPSVPPPTAQQDPGSALADAAPTAPPIAATPKPAHKAGVAHVSKTKRLTTSKTSISHH